MSKKTVKVSMELPELPEGFEYTGEYRKVMSGDYYLDLRNKVSQWESDFVCTFEYPIIRKCEVWRDATAQDIYEVLSGKEVFVRFAGNKLLLVGGQIRWDCSDLGKPNLTFLLKRGDMTTFWAGACEVRVS